LRFAVHRPGCPVASPRIHGVPRRNVPGRVYVSIVGETAGGAPEDGLALARLSVHLPACRAALARKRWVDSLYPVGRFLFQAAYQDAPSGPEYALVKRSFCANVPTRMPDCPFGRTRHVPDLEVFDPDQVEPASDVSAGLLSPVLAPVCLLGAHPGGRKPHPRAAVRASLGAGKLALQPPQPSLLPRSQARHVQHFPGGQSCRHRHTSVEAYDLAIFRCGDRLGNSGEGDMPASCPIQSNPVRLYSRRLRTGPAEPYPSRLRNPDLTGLPAESAHIPLPPASPNDAESLVTSGPPPGRASGRVLWVEEGSLRMGKVPQRLLLHHLATCSQPVMLRACGGELSALLEVARRVRAADVPVRVLLDGQVPHVSGVCAVVTQYRLLGWRGEQPISGHANTLSSYTDIFREGSGVSFIVRRPGLARRNLYERHS
jgi:hypothetical protein